MAIHASETLLRAMDDTVREQLVNVTTLPGIVGAAHAMPDAHWGYGFPIGGSGITVRSPSSRGVAEEAPGAYKNVAEVVLATEQAGLTRRVARLQPLICIKG